MVTKYEWIYQNKLKTPKALYRKRKGCYNAIRSITKGELYQ